jgi:hypothetical protein
MAKHATTRAVFLSLDGSSVFGRSSDEIEVNEASLNAPDQLTPTYESWIRRGAWLPPFPLTRRLDRDCDANTRFGYVL